MIHQHDMMCGGCGHKHFSIKFTGSDSHEPDSLIIYCDKCGSDSIVSLRTTLTVGWGSPSATGCLCDSGD